MKTLRMIALAALAGTAMLALGGCTSTSTRSILTIVSLNNGNAFTSHITDSLSATADVCPIMLGNIPNDGSAPLAPDSPFSEIVVTSYTVTYDNGVYPPFSAGLTLRVGSGEETSGTIALNSPSSKVSASPSSTTARVTVYGFVLTNGGNNGDQVKAIGSLPIVVY